MMRSDNIARTFVLGAILVGILVAATFSDGGMLEGAIITEILHLEGLSDQNPETVGYRLANDNFNHYFDTAVSIETPHEPHS